MNEREVREATYGLALDLENELRGTEAVFHSQRRDDPRMKALNGEMRLQAIILGHYMRLSVLLSGLPLHMRSTIATGMHEQAMKDAAEMGGALGGLAVTRIERAAQAAAANEP